MKPIRDSEVPLVWIQPSLLSRAWALRDASELIATLEWKSAYQASAVGATATGEWSFRLEGFFRSWVTVTRLDRDDPPARLRALPSFNGKLELPDDRILSWDSNFWLTKWIWSASEGLEIMRMSRNLSLRTEGTLDWDPRVTGIDELPMLALLGWYLIILVSDIRPG